MQEKNISAHNFEQCQKCAICTTVCPILANNELYPGPKQAGPDGERYRLKNPIFYQDTLKYCLNCKRCEVACPSGVEIGDIIQSAKLEMGKRHHVLRDTMLASTDLMGSVATPIAPLVNATLALKPVKAVMDAVIGVHKGRTLPKYSHVTFEKWFRKNAAHNIGVFSKAVAKGNKVLTVSTSCTLTIRDEYPHLLGVDNSEVRDNIQLVEKFLYQQLSSGRIKLVWKEGYKARAAYHAPCHQEKLGWANFTIELLRMIPGLELTVLDSHCCGIAGTYGFKKENYEVSQKVGKPLFDNIAAVNPDFVACECETCKWQIEMSSGYEVKNPVSILAEALDLEATAKANI